MIDQLPFVSLVREFVTLLSQGEFAEIERRSGGMRLSAAELATAVAEYPYSLEEPPAASTELWEVYELSDDTGWAVVVPLWTREEGRSDLSLDLTVRRAAAGLFRVEVDGILVH